MTTLTTHVQINTRLAPATPGGIRSASDAMAPPISELLLKWFRWYARRHIRRHFHSVRIGGDLPYAFDGPLIGYVNHASWWDPMLLVVFGEHVILGRHNYAPIDAEALKRYPLLSKLGLFGVQQHSRKGALEFLQTSEAILASENTALWLTPQGRFCDVRERPPKFNRGIGALARRSGGTRFLPVAVEYTFWQERLPEMLIWIGKSIEVSHGAQRSTSEWTTFLEERLAVTQDTLAKVSMERDTKRLRTVLKGGSGASATYDAWRQLKSRITGVPFEKDHGQL
jgi:1-acyl-sn-glycerol-3-phosphate acyltransferase